MKVILFQPQIPQNTGNIVRTCCVTGCELALVRPLGFSTSHRMLKRAGLDYWEGVNVSFLDDLMEELLKTEHPFYFFSSHAKQVYTEATYPPSSLLIFGSETAGLPDSYREKWPDRFYTLPMKPGARCLNLANAVSIVVYEAWKQNGFT
jgi:tRNA (cytidine/uridine-2'-O-)-methyltransferase